jgi:D-glycero-D-manno-heptose 1,7-bisphosphate phosphatase
MNSAVFLDRDGVIIQNRSAYVRCWEDVEFLPVALQALYLLSQSAYKIIIITNQSAVGRGIISMAQANEINDLIIQQISEAGGRVDGLYVCPHSPSENCPCRKPKPGLILQAAEELMIDLKTSYMIGDALTDLQAGQAAGIPNNILVKTGRGSDQLGSQLNRNWPPHFVVDNLSSAIEMIHAGRP